MLQTRSGKRTAAAARRIAVDKEQKKLIDRRQAVARIDPASLDQLLHPMLDPKAKRNVIARGLPASPGAAAGRAVFSADEAEDRAAKGETVILVRVETSPEDIPGMHAAAGILTKRRGMTSHAPVAARGGGGGGAGGGQGGRGGGRSGEGGEGDPGGGREQPGRHPWKGCHGGRPEDARRQDQ